MFLGDTVKAIRQLRSSAPWSDFRAWRARRPFGGGVLTVLAGIELFFSGQLDLGNIHVQVGIEGFQSTIIPVVMVTLGLLAMFTPTHRIFYGVISLAVSVYSLIGLNLGGFFIGMILGSVGGVLVVSWMPKKADAGAAGATPEMSTEPTPKRRERTTPADPLPLARSRS
ncbi:MAG TPA: DUF6114 domain-containing protein [Galbitalea sp.]|jgi:hypothetical protein|nr:DUF6114 domain-containing protein [Galbitalea sp.]